MAVLIAGPTASGKSALALQLAQALGGTVVNADAMQVYRDLRVLTARPAPQEEAAAPHALYGSVDGAEPYGVGAWLNAASEVLETLRAAERPAVIVGGTGLYLSSLETGLSPVPPIEDDVRALWRGQLLAVGAEALHRELEVRDSQMAQRLRPSDGQRIVRALEVIDGTGRSLADWQEEAGDGPLGAFERVERVVLSPGRDVVRARILTRFEAMMEAGAVDEAVALSARGLPETLPVMKAIGVAPLSAYARGALHRSDAVLRAVTESRQYAKRQDTWFRNRFANWVHAVDPAAARETILRGSFVAASGVAE